MELFLNITWLLVAGTIVCLWLPGKGRARAERRRQIIAISVLIAILFPVISVSDDLLAIQNASEADNYPRRDHLIPSSANPVQPLLAITMPSIFAGLGFGFPRLISPGLLPVHEPDRPEMAGIDSRPPPGV
jgi:O-antigen ligase